MCCLDTDKSDIRDNKFLLSKMDNLDSGSKLNSPMFTFGCVTTYLLWIYKY